MASGSYADKSVTRELSQNTTPIPLRATRQLPALVTEDDIQESSSLALKPSSQVVQQSAYSEPKTISLEPRRRIVDEYAPPAPLPLERHRFWLNPLVICLVCVVVGLGVLLSAGIFQHAGDPQLVNFTGGKVYSVQVGGSLANTWQANGPLQPKVPIIPSSGPYSVLGQPTLTADFINRVLANYNSPAAGKGQALYNLGIQYGIDPAFALAFFFHESAFGTQGEARVSLSLGNLRCIPNFKCQDGYAWFPSWESGFQAWYSLIRNLYVAQWGLTTVSQIIPRYAPPSDNNNDSAYIGSVEHSIDVWHAGQLQP